MKEQNSSLITVISMGTADNPRVGLDNFICVCVRVRLIGEVAVTETVTFQIKFERSKACVNAIE